MRPNLLDTRPPLATLMVATCNVLNLANAGRVFYPNQDAYTRAEYERKVEWLGGRFRMLNADVLAVQEVWDEAAFKEALSRSGLRYDFVSVPGAENDAKHQGAQGTPRVSMATRLKVEAVQSFADFPPAFQVEVPGLGMHMRFERPPMVVTDGGHTAHEARSASERAHRPPQIQAPQIFARRTGPRAGGQG